jgi:hypothetical protein
VRALYRDADRLISPAPDQVRRRLSQSNNATCPRREHCGGVDLVKGAKDPATAGRRQTMVWGNRGHLAFWEIPSGADASRPLRLTGMGLPAPTLPIMIANRWSDRLERNDLAGRGAGCL